MLKYIKIILLLFLFVSCGEIDPRIIEGIPREDVWTIIEVDAVIDSGAQPEPDILPPPDTFQIQDVHKKEPDAAAEYKESCWEAVWLRCPPYEEYWIAEAVIDICDDYSIVMIDNCRLVHECDPTDPIIAIQTCQTEEGFPGQQYVVCDKGKVDLTDCWKCDDTEICDLEDNDCDGIVDEGTYECTTVCEVAPAYCIEGEIICTAEEPEEEICNYLDDDCDNEIDEHQRNACDKCGPIPEEVCDGIDNDCNGLMDENLLQECETVCEKGYEICLSGMWSNCTAQQPIEEWCNAEDDDCDGNIDEDLDCVCSAADVGILIPCMEDPLICGQGYKTCECAVEPAAGQMCTEFGMTQCKATCYYFPPPADVICDEQKGIIISEICNNHDDDCDGEIDEDLFKSCYTGPAETLNVGICKAGNLMCSVGKWGNFIEEIFIDDLCMGEVLPLPEELCNGLDDNCDGELEDDMNDTDVLFILDTSGSMNDEIDAIVSALNMFALYYSDEDVIKWGLIYGPIWEKTTNENGASFIAEVLKIKHNFSAFSAFLTALSSTDFSQVDGSREMLYDALYLSLLNIASPNSIEYGDNEISWTTAYGTTIYSDPVIPKFTLSWRGLPKEAKRVVVIFTDETAQSYMSPQITNDILLKLEGGVKDLSVFVFSPTSTANSAHWDGTYVGWENLCQVGNGQWFELTNNPEEIFNNLMQILDNTVCE